MGYSYLIDNNHKFPATVRDKDYEVYNITKIHHLLHSINSQMLRIFNV